jgi:hypothetical protein
MKSVRGPRAKRRQSRWSLAKETAKQRGPIGTLCSLAEACRLPIYSIASNPYRKRVCATVTMCELLQQGAQPRTFSGNSREGASGINCW